MLVGGGSAGCVLANRLSASGVYSVCVLERGSSVEKFPEKAWIVRHPWSWMWTISQPTPFTFPYFAIPQKHCNGRRIHTPRGITFGGSGAINGTCWVRCDPRDYDRWAKEDGCSGWSFRECLPYFKRMETYESGIKMDAKSLAGGLDEVIEQDKAYGREIAKYRGDSGPMRTVSGRVVYERYTKPSIAPAIIRAGMQAGYRYNPDHNGPDFEGIGWLDTNVRDGTRDNTGQAYLEPIKGRSNLHTTERAFVSRILFDEKKSEIRAVGVEYQDLDSGEIKSIVARKEVILCAGAYNSPQILMLSGVGDRNHLKEMGIKSVHHLPGVGRNLQDHPSLFIGYDIQKSEFGFPIGDWSDSNEYANKVRAEWEQTRTGKAGSNQVEAVLFARTSHHVPYANMQVLFTPGPRNAGKAGEMNIVPGMVANPCVLRPKSVGILKLQSSNPADAPLIDPNTFDKEEDLEELIDGVLMVRKILSQPALKEFIGEELVPGASIASRDQLRDFIRENVILLFHPIGTCRMGDPACVPDPSLLVVDTSLRVCGIAGLRVVDASVMPSLPSGNTHQPTLMIAEKAADLILNAV